MQTRLSLSVLNRPWFSSYIGACLNAGEVPMSPGEKLNTSEQLLQQALEARHRYREALGSVTPEEVERLGLEAVSLMKTVQAYQQRDWELGW